MTSSGLSPNKITVLVGAVCTLGSLPTVWLFKQFGRKTILWVCSFAIGGSLCGLGLSLLFNVPCPPEDLSCTNTTGVLSIVFLMLFIVLFQFSLGPLLWIYMSEIMTEKGLTMSTALNWAVSVCIALFTGDLIDLLSSPDSNHPTHDPKDTGSGILFLICGGISTLCGLFCLFFLKETKGLPEKEVAKLYSRETPRTEAE